MYFPNFKTESRKILRYSFVAGCDEVGMGPLAGPVVAAVCILSPKDFSSRKKSDAWFSRVRDSKTIPEAERLELEGAIKKNCLAYGIGKSSVLEIDRLNIHYARQKAMYRAWNDLLKKFPKYNNKNGIILIDGTFTVSEIECDQEAIVKGDASIMSIAAASILAKNCRDKYMIRLHAKHPEYGFAEHKGYGTEKHVKALRRYGATEIHRKSFLKKVLPEK
jgi:ribonuclease HII